jgi:hypothetical protein
MHSKSILRAVAAEASDTMNGVDYFPSYELITSPCFGSGFFEANQRQVTPAGVQFVMGQFFESLRRAGADVPEPNAASQVPAGETAALHRRRRAQLVALQRQNAEACEEALLDAFGGAP